MRNALKSLGWWLLSGYLGMAAIWGICAGIQYFSATILSYAWPIAGASLFVTMVLTILIARNIIAAAVAVFALAVVEAAFGIVLYIVGVKIFDWIAWVPSLPFRSVVATLIFSGFLIWLFFRVKRPEKSSPSLA